MEKIHTQNNNKNQQGGLPPFPPTSSSFLTKRRRLQHQAQSCEGPQLLHYNQLMHCKMVVVEARPPPTAEYHQQERLATPGSIRHMIHKNKYFVPSTAAIRRASAILHSRTPVMVKRQRAPSPRVPLALPSPQNNEGVSGLSYKINKQKQ